MRNVIFEANCLYYKNDEVSVSCEEDVMNICITGDSRSVYLTPSQAKAMSLAVMRRFCFDPFPDPLTELERRVVETTAHSVTICADPTELVRAVARAPDPLTELERRVVETAIARHIAYKECDASRANSDGYARGVAIARAADSSGKAHREAVDALLVARAPKDPPHLESVARAICIAGGEDPDADWRQRGGTTLTVHCPGDPANWRRYLPQARAAVAALEQKESK